MKETAGSMIVARWKEDHGPGPPYTPIMRTSVLVDNGERVHGKRYYHRAEENAASIQWISDRKALDIIARHGIILLT